MTVADEREAASLTRLWEERWPASPPVAQWIRDAYADRWVRFHSLAGGKRYPDSEAEDAIMLHRHETVLSALSPDSHVLVFRTAWTSAALPLPPAPVWPALRAPNALAPKPWRTLPPSEQLGESFTHLFFEICPWPFPALQDLLHAVAHEEIHQVILAAVDLRWLYLPYDGGADIIAPTVAIRDALRDEHADWLSEHEGGL